jgi:hypothetical protein
MAHIAADGSRWTNAAQARRVPGRAQGDGKQPVSKFPKPEAPRQPTAEPVSATPDDSSQAAPSTPEVQVTHDGNMYTVTAKFASEDEAQAAAQALQGGQGDDQSQMNPAQAMM